MDSRVICSFLYMLRHGMMGRVYILCGRCPSVVDQRSCGHRNKGEKAGAKGRDSNYSIRPVSGGEACTYYQ